LPADGSVSLFAGVLRVGKELGEVGKVAVQGEVRWSVVNLKAY